LIMSTAHRKVRVTDLTLLPGSTDLREDLDRFAKEVMSVFR
jgi:hypothetical protein